MSEARAIAPILGGLVLFSSAAIAFYFDYELQKRTEEQNAILQNRSVVMVLPRPLSYVTYDPHSPASRIFFVGLTISTVCMSLTGYFQSEEAESNKFLLIFFPTAAGVCGLLMVAGARLYGQGSEMFAFVFHIITAGAFQAFMIMYSFLSAELAKQIWGDESAMYVARRTFSLMAAICAGVACMIAKNAVPMGDLLVKQEAFMDDTAIEDKRVQDCDGERDLVDETGAPQSLLENDRIQEREANANVRDESSPSGANNPMTPEEIWTSRAWLAALAAAQMAMGFSESVMIGLGAAEALR